MSSSRQLAAIMFADIVGFTAMMQEDEMAAMNCRQKLKQKLEEVVAAHQGRILEFRGDGALCSFTSTIQCVKAALALQLDMQTTPVVPLRIGLHTGDVIFEGDNMYGDGVNIASRMESFAIPGSIFISAKVYDDIKNQKDIQTVSLGKYALKNVKEQVEIFAVSNPGIIVPESNNLEGKGEKVPEKKEIEKSIAVLSFINMSSDPEQEYFSDGISEEIINMLSHVPGLKVAGRTSSFSFKNKNEDLRSIGDKLNVSTVLEGSVRSAGNRIRITAQLIDVQNGYHLWSEKYNRVLNDIFEVQDEIAQIIVEKLQITLGGKLVETKSREQTQNVEAYQYYLKGRALVYKRGKYLFEALPHFQKALEIDPEYALAYAGMADTHTIICYYGLLMPNETWPKAIECAGKAMRFGPDLAESHNCNACIALLHDWNWDEANREYLKALELNPGYEQARTWYGLFYLQMAFLRHEEAIAHARKAVENNPLSFYSTTILGLTLGIAGNNEEGLEKTKRGVELEPNSYITQIFLANLYDWSGHYEESVQTYEKALQLSNRHSWALSMLTATHVNWSKKEKAEETYRELLDQSKQKYVQPGTLAAAAACLGKNEDALKFAHQACDEHDPYLLFICKAWPISKLFRAIPGYDLILKRMKLSE